MTQTSLTIYIVAALIALLVSVPGVVTQIWLYNKEKARQRASPLFSAWSELQTELAKTLHHPHPESAPMDKLLEKLETFTVVGLSEITDDERRALIGMLRKIADDKNQKDSERQRAQFLLFAMPHAQKEQEAKASADK
jgi:hypothetical protein